MGNYRLKNKYGITQKVVAAAAEKLTQAGTPTQANEGYAVIAAKIANVDAKCIGLTRYETIANFVGPQDISRCVALKKANRAKRLYREQSRLFYQSREWLSLRYDAIRMHGGRCMACGASAADGVEIHVDHIKPRSTHPELQLELTNLQVLCKPCNLGKSNRDATDWRK